MIARMVLALALGAAAITAAAPAGAHAVVKQSVPAKGALLAVAPTEVVITFNEKVEKLFSTVSLANGAGVVVPTAKAQVDAADPAVLRLPLPALPSGAYVVRWTAVGHDGHRLSGTIGFRVK